MAELGGGGAVQGGEEGVEVGGREGREEAGVGVGGVVEEAGELAEGGEGGGRGAGEVAGGAAEVMGG